VSDTTGWYRTPQSGYEKDICGYFFEIEHDAEGWDLRILAQYCATRPTLRECQQLAHATARLWAGEKEC